MSFKIHFLLSFLLLFYIADAFNITQIFNKYSEFSTFNSYLTQTSLAGEINSRQTITVFVVSNGNISQLSEKSKDVLKAIMSVHVVLDYYDIKKLESIPNKTLILTTLFQTSGNAVRRQGFLNVTDSGSDVKIGSAVPGSRLDARLKGSVTSQPYNISVIQISNVIVPDGIDNSTSAPPPTTSPKAAKSPTPAKSPSPGKSRKSPPPHPSKSPEKSPADADSPTADAADADDSSSSGIGLRLGLEAVFLIVSSAISLAVV